MRYIPLTQSKRAIVDDEDFEYLNQWKWSYDSGYAARRKYFKDGSSVKIRMHRLLNNTPKGYDTDHLNRDKLDNRKENLRTVTRSENVINCGMLKNNTSGYKGIRWHTLCNKWQARFTHNGKAYYLGTYSELEDAVKARDEAVREFHGEYAHQNRQ